MMDNLGDITYWIAAGIFAASYFGINPNDFKVIRAPHDGTDFMVVCDVQPYLGEEYGQYSQEKISLQHFKDGRGRDIWMGYGRRSKCLVVRDSDERH